MGFNPHPSPTTHPTSTPHSNPPQVYTIGARSYCAAPILSTAGQSTVSFFAVGPGLSKCLDFHVRFIAIVQFGASNGSRRPHPTPTPDCCGGAPPETEVSCPSFSAGFTEAEVVADLRFNLHPYEQAAKVSQGWYKYVVWVQVDTRARITCTYTRTRTQTLVCRYQVAQEPVFVRLVPDGGHVRRQSER